MIDRLDAEILLAEVLQCSRATLIAHSERVLTQDETHRYQEYMTRRKKGEPVAYILGRKEFWSLELKVTPDTLIPRSETELIVEQVLTLFPDKKTKRVIADLGTGSGAVALALAHEYPTWEIHATDQSSAALKVAFENAAHLGITNIQFHQGSWCKALPLIYFDAIVSNPPYLSVQETSPPFEPSSALFSGSDGLDAIREIASESKKFLKTGGYLILEHGYTQAQQVREILKNAGYSAINSICDLAGIERVTLSANRV